MKKIIGYIFTITLSVVCVSCGSDITKLSETAVFYDDYPTSVFATSDSIPENVSKNVKPCISSLNKAIVDCPGLNNMLIADMIDGGHNDYVYSGSESFLKVLDDFAAENYHKAKAMLPEMTVEEFYYHTAVGYSIANRYTAMQFLLTSDIESCKLDVTFDEVLIFGFWNSYYYFDDSRISNKTIDATIDTNVLDIPISLDYLVETQVKLRSFLYYLNSLKDKGDRIDVFVDDYIIDIINSTNNSANYTLSDNLFNEISAGSRFFSILLEDTLKQKSQTHFFVGNVCSALSNYFVTILPPDQIGSVHPFYYSTFILNSCFDSKIMGSELLEWILESANID
ncbi:MAG TPA: hypothetical protein PKV16_01650 [Caldisericia bacterium]|nr:hypothetical protein [Caldisericia bacterium]HPF48893.1 hypothetical protein [Caldisericia bacterium]HPI83243.1 hypothetical protein [Caldisericia bacterium]HPQ92470.1 hypothetical protein [Caldisericia bacterium]HRV74432.1 hypothetical protein [Caldisericia bacterium]